jgi:FAD/FMN-containing dehydrogenase/Fe-S oxidoreductase
VSVLEPRRTRPRVDVDRAGLTRRLRETVEGEVRFDTAARALYATDASNFRQPPIGVVIPKTLDDVVAAHAACHEFGAPIVNRGCGTSLSGETVNVAVVVDHSKHLTAIGDPDTRERTVEVEPGAVSDKVNEHLSEWNLVFAPDPSTHAYCTIGGNVGNNSCGVHSVQSQFYGPGPRTSDNVHSLEILTHDGLRTWVGATPPDELDAIVAAGGRKGEIYAALRDLAERHADEIRRRFPPVDRLPRRVSGYNIDELLPEQSFNVARALTGTESTCVTVLRAKLLLTPALLARALVVVAYEDIFAAGDHVPQVLEHEPVGCEAIDDVLFADEQHLNLHPRELEYLPQEGNAWLLVEFGADTQAEADERAHAFIAALGREGIGNGRVSLFDDPEGEARLWAVREAGLAATAFPPDGDHWPGWEDSAVPPERVGDYLRDLRRLYERHGLRGALYGHLGQGCIHSRISFNLRTPGGLATYRRFLEEAADLVVSYGGSLSGEHGDGQQRAELLGRQFGDEILDAFREFKRIWDPDARMNPGKVVDPYRFDEDLKLGVDYEPWRPPVEFAYEEDGGDFAHAALRCVGVGKCRQPDAVDVMCPSFVVTREEMHTTRGRARLLFEMLEGDIVTDGWRSAEVMEALDLCLACKGCTADCPVSVDMPTYKAEFLHHHWAGRLRPRHAYAFGLVDKVARVASVVPEAANLVTRTPLVAAGLKRAAGMAPERSIPEFAPLTLQAWFHGRGERNVGGPRVLLWPDTFSNRFHSEVGVASVHALEAAGFHVTMPRGHVCCGRPLYDYGFLDLAKRYLRRSIDLLRAEVRAGTPVVGLEPSCVAVFKDELCKLLPHDDDARRLAAAVRHFGEFLAEQDYTPPPLAGKALLWGHCHQKATGGAEPERTLLESMGVEVEPVVGGCCGLAGSWGFEAAHYDLSIKAGEHALLPAVRAADPATLVVAGGFSCRTQIADGATGRRALHLAQVLDVAQRFGPAGPPGERPERQFESARPRPSAARRAGRAALLAGAGGAVAAAALAAPRLRD